MRFIFIAATLLASISARAAEPHYAVNCHGPDEMECDDAPQVDVPLFDRVHWSIRDYGPFDDSENYGDEASRDAAELECVTEDAPKTSDSHQATRLYAKRIVECITAIEADKF